jgi:hypothetical protein
MEAILIVGLLALAAYVLVIAPRQGSDDVSDLGGQVDTSNTNLTKAIAQAIATAEGFYVSGSRPARNHNPGDMTADLIGKAVGKDGAFVVYANDSDGWANLYAQINAWLEGTSAHANADSTIHDVSRFYTTTDQDAWANTVASKLGVSIDTPIGQVA